MTHMTNYGSDRLALYLFEGVVQQLQRTTHFKLKTEPPLYMARRYFDLYPEEADPLWGVGRVCRTTTFRRLTYFGWCVEYIEPLPLGGRPTLGVG